jgi:small-conductance mechanosensitive channel
MPPEFREIWDFVLYSTGDGQPLTIGNVVAVLLLVVSGYLVSRFIGYLFGQRLAATRLSPDVAYTIKRVVFLSLLVLVALTALNLLGVPLTAFAFATGAIAIGVGFGAQNIINNFISGWILMAERPIRIADFIEIDGTTGVVELIGTRSTRIRRTDGVHLLVPNSRLLEQTVVNWTLVDREIRTVVRVGVAYGSPVRQVSDLIMQAVEAQPEVKEHPAPSVVFEEFGDNSLVFDTFFWCDVGGEKFLREIRSEVRFRISDLFLEHGITIAFPQRDVHLDTLRPLDIRLMPANDADE